ncbi:MAG: NUDIX hydrolase [Euryarchaeota archaeon TMED141]|nr:MAG: NUDIX hydrolase [Euryarchaeota archaeon TMED141]
MTMDHPPVVVHLEHDGKVLLVDAEGRGPIAAQRGRIVNEPFLRFPTPSEVASMGIDHAEPQRVNHDDVNPGVTVLKAYPHIPWPESWPWKDDLISDNAVHPVARESVYRSLHRVVSKAIVVNDEGHVLMGRVARGHFTGHWTLPGGYLDHDEHPHAGCIREAFEEFGLRITLNDAAPVVTQRVFDRRGLSFLSFTYTSTETVNQRITVEPSEIAEGAWFPAREALEHAVSYFDRTALKAHLER